VKHGIIYIFEINNMNPGVFPALLSAASCGEFIAGIEHPKPGTS